MSDSNNDGSDERGFLHDLASPLGTAMLLVDSLLEDLQERASIDPDDVMRTVEIHQALERLSNLLKNRREILIARGVPSARK